MTKRHKEPKIPQNPAQLSGAAAAAVPNPDQQAQSPHVAPVAKGEGQALSQAQNTSAPAPAPSMKKYLVAFWSAVAVVVAVSWTLEHFMPLTHEYIIERWVMLAFGGFLAVFLFFLK